LIDDTVLPDIADTVDVDTCPFARVVDVVQPFLTETQTELPSMMMIPSRIMAGSTPRIMMTVRSSAFSVILDSGAEMSVLPLTLAANFQLPIQLPDTVHEVRTFGPSTATLFGPVPLEISICGVLIRHPFYFVDATLPPVVGYDLMKAARLLVDVDNHLVWSRRLPASVPSSPNPPVSVSNPTVNACVSFVCPEPPALPAKEPSPRAPVVEVPSPVSVSGSESPSPMSSVVSRQVSVVVPPLRPCASTLNPNASLFRPRAASLPSDAHRPHADLSTQHRYLPVYPLVDLDDTLVKTPPQSGSIFSIARQPKDTTVPLHLQELFDETVSNAHLSESLQQNLAAVLRCNSDAFATGPLDLGFCAALQHNIDTGDALQIKQSPRRPPFAAREAEDAILDEMLQTGVIEPSNSPWSSPVCMVKKKDDTYRFCIDYCRLNDVTKKDAFPVPDVKDALDSLHGAKYFATIDLLSRYWQLGMTDRAKERSAFCTRRGLFQFTRMPFGLSNAPFSFCRLMHIILKDMLYVLCLCYLDDIVVFSNSPEQLIDRPDAVFSRLRQYGLKAKPSKCVFFKSPIEFLGHLVSADGIEPQPAKLDTIRDWPTPHCLRDVRAFFRIGKLLSPFCEGLCYHRRTVISLDS